MLSSVTNAPVQRARGAQSQAESGSNSDSNDAARQDQHIQKSSAIHNHTNACPTDAIQKREGESSLEQQGKVKSSATDGDTKATKGSDKIDQLSGRKAPSKKTAFTVQEAPAFNLQDSTAQLGFTGIFTAPATNIASDAIAGSTELTGTSQATQQMGGVADEGSNAQLQTPTQTATAGKDNNAEFASLKMQAALQAGSQDQSADTVDSKAVSDLHSASGSALADAGAGSVKAATAATAHQASLAVQIERLPVTKQGDSSLNQPVDSPIQSVVSEAASGPKSDAGKSGKNDDGNGRSSSHSFDGAITQAQSAQSAGAHVAGTGNAGDVLQTPTIVPHAETHNFTGEQTAPSGPTPAHGGEGAETAAANRWQSGEIAGMSGISTAKLIQNMSGTEMRVGMHSSEFGDISIRTSISQQQMQTQISVDHNELGNALSAHIPSMQAKMGSDYGLHATIEVNQGGASFSSDGGRSQNHQHEALVPRIGSVESITAVEHESIGLSSVIQSRGDSRLDIRA